MTTRLGFHPPLTRLYIFIKNEANALWYYLEDGTKRYIQDTALTGVLKRFEVKESETTFSTELKADFEIVADRRYVLRSGIDTAFTKGMLMAIATLTDEQLKRPITLELKPGEQKGNVLVSARNPETFEPITTGKWEGTDWDELMNQALARLGGEVTSDRASGLRPASLSSGGDLRMPASVKGAKPQQPQPAPTPQPAPNQHNAIIRKIRLMTGHTPEQIVAWCLERNAATPADLPPELCQQLAEALALSWGKSKFDSPELCKNAFNGKVGVLTASGVHWGEVIACWIASVQGEPVARH